LEINGVVCVGNCCSVLKYNLQRALVLDFQLGKDSSMCAISNNSIGLADQRDNDEYSYDSIGPILAQAI
jgi:hypothetical protein